SFLAVKKRRQALRISCVSGGTQKEMQGIINKIKQTDNQLINSVRLWGKGLCQKQLKISEWPPLILSNSPAFLCF
ncbi:MAG: hypothetical protein ACYC4Q_09455, partial [Victivallaceae bacterium]